MNLRTSVLARLLVMGVLMLLLLIPLAMTESVIAERTGRRNSVAAEVSTTWGGAQTISGPVLVVPYRTTTMSNANNKPVQTMGRASFLPEALDVQGIVDPDLRKRNLFKVVVYRAHLKLTGRFTWPASPAQERSLCGTKRPSTSASPILEESPAGSRSSGTGRRSR